MIDFNNKYILGGMPLAHIPEAPKDQSPCIIEKCPECGKAMWVSEKKRYLRKTKDAYIACIPCVVIQADAAGLEIEMGDINQFLE